jgi:hypothetical protein
LDKSNDRVDTRMMLHFRRALNHLEVKEIQLVGRKYNWSNARQLPTMSRIDRAFCIIAWKSHFINPIIQPLSSAVSNQCPLLLVPLIPLSLIPYFNLRVSGQKWWASKIVSKRHGTGKSLAATTLLLPCA